LQDLAGELEIADPVYGGTAKENDLAWRTSFIAHALELYRDPRVWDGTYSERQLESGFDFVTRDQISSDLSAVMILTWRIIVGRRHGDDPQRLCKLADRLAGTDANGDGSQDDGGRTGRLDEQGQDRLGQCDAVERTPGKHGGGETSQASPVRGWREVQEELETRRQQGETYTAQKELADLLGVSASTINKAINNSPKLKGWKERGTQRKSDPPAANVHEGAISDGLKQTTECDPGEQVAREEQLNLLVKEQQADYEASPFDDKAAPSRQHKRG
jgi:transposase